MGIVEAFVLGLMVAWTPPLLLLAWMLWRNALSDDGSDIPSRTFN
jgi:hypothetical protein